MCGISGIIYSENQKSNYDISSMLSAIRHRGNNIPHYEKVGNAFLGNVLLDITDSKNGIQPILNKDKNLIIVLNGEIYNYKILKKILKQKGYVFKTKTDTEVLLYLYNEYKEKVVDLLDGMYSFVIYDKKDDTYFVTRDPYGIKPLYYLIKEGNFYFSSELKSFNKEDSSLLKELEPGHFIKNGTLKKWYTKLDFFKIDKNIKYQVAQKKVKKLILESVKKRINTKEPILVFFSGGVDSTIILNLVVKLHNKVLALIIGQDHAPDTVHAIKYCKENKIKYKRINFRKKSLLNLIPKIIYTLETFEPNPVRGATLSYLLSQEAQKMGFKIALCGEGSDEIFGGYGDFLRLDGKNFIDFQINLLKDLYRTQLLRVDRTAMNFNLEVRVPFLDKELVEFALSLPQEFKIGSGKKLITKFILREAFKDELPDYIYKREKMTLMKGAGAGAVNRSAGIFFDFADKQLSHNEFQKIQKNNPAYNLLDKEAAFYFKIFNKYYKDIKFAENRTNNALFEIMEVNEN